MLFKLAAFAGFVLLLARMGGWRLSLPRTLADALSTPFRRSDGFESESDSGDSGDGEGVTVHAGGALLSSATPPRTPAGSGGRPGLVERWTTWLERWSTGAPPVVHEAAAGPTDRELERAALVEHLLRERARTAPSLPATRIVESAADQEGVPWGRVSRATVWRVWRELPDG